MLIKIFLLENGGTTCKIVETQIRCHNVASDLGLHFFANTPLRVSSMKWDKAKIYGVLYNQASSIAFDETSSYWSALKSS